jgi:hypothetical protein
MDLKTDIEKQFQAGFTREDIYKNLQDKGYSTTEIDQHYVTVSNDPAISNGEGGGVSGKNLAIGALFLVIMIWRLSRIKSGNAGNTFLIIGVITAFILAILYFTRRK